MRHAAMKNSSSVLDAEVTARSNGLDITSSQSDVSVLSMLQRTLPRRPRHEIGANTTSSEHITNGTSTTANHAVKNIFDSNDTKPSTTCHGVNSSPSKMSGKHLWKPFWISTMVLVTFTYTFIFLLSWIVFFFYYSKSHQGIATQRPENHYAWKYGPTAVFVIINAFWRQVAFTVRVCLPWIELHRSAGSIDKALELDYITPIIPVTLWNAVKNKHWPVVLSTLGHILILATTATSTGLLSLEISEISQETTSLRLNSELRLLKDWNPNNGTRSPRGVGATVLYGIYEYGLPYPPGTSPTILIPEIEATYHPSIDIGFTTQAEGIQINAGCDVVAITNITTQYAHRTETYLIDIDAPECTAKNFPLAVLDSTAYANYRPGDCIATFSEVPCDHRTQKDSAPDSRLFIAMTVIAQDKYSMRYVNQTAAVLCNPSYFTALFDIQKDISSDERPRAALPPELKESTSQLEGLSNKMLLEAITKDIAWKAWSDSKYPMDLNNQFAALLSSTGRQEHREAFLDPYLLANTSTTILQGVAVQLLRHFAMQPTSQNIAGQVILRENRLKVAETPAVLMCALLGLLGVLPLGIIFTHTPLTVPTGPKSIAAVAFILSSGPGLSKLIKHEKFLSSFRAPDIPRKNNTLIIHDGNSGLRKHNTGSDSPEASLGQIKWWKPLASTRWFFGIAIGLPVFLVVILEILKISSDKHEGIFEVTVQYTAIFTTYIPAAVALGIAALYSSFELLAGIITPYATLNRQRATYSQALGFSCAGKLLPHAFYLAFNYKHYALMMAMAGSFLGSFLTIITAGLFSIVDTPTYTSSSFVQTEMFNLSNSFDDYYFSSKAIIAATLIECQNMSFPKETYEDLTFSQINQVSHLGNNSSSLSITMPAIRPRLNCTKIQNSDRKIGDIAYRPREEGLFIDFSINTTMSRQDWCDEELSPQNPPTLVWIQNYLDIPVNEQNTYIANSVMPELGPNCPTFSVTLGTVRVSKSASDGKEADLDIEQDLGTVLCYQNLEEVNTTFYFKLPGYGVDQSHPPSPDESSVKLLLNKAGSPRFNTTLREMASLLGGAGYDDESPTSAKTILGNDVFDPFVNTMVHGLEKRPLEEIAGEKNVDTLMALTNRLYGRYMAQVYSVESRTKNEPNASSIVYQGMVTSSGAKRLLLSHVSKLTLQVMLCLMILCAIGMKILLPTNELLPQNPCSIEGKASLLMNGSLLSPELYHCFDSWEGSPEEFLEKGFEKRTYSLKWWKNGNGEERYGIDVDEEDSDK